MTAHLPPLDEARVAAALADYHRRQAAGESVWPLRYRDELGPLYPEFEELVAIEGELDRSMRAERQPSLPRVFGRYTFRAVLGRGGMGTVFLADDRKLGRQVAVKVLHAGFAHADDVLRKRFHQEATTCGSIQSDHVVAIHDVDEHEGELYYVMDVVPGESLAARLRRGERPDVRALAAGLRDIARALQLVHDKGIVHRDVKPGNVMVTPEGKYVLTDFGLARRMQDARLTRTGQLVGTLPYMSPGQVKGNTDAATPATDVYGLGALLYEALTGQLPFGGEDSEAVIARILHERPRPPRAIDPAIPEGLESIALRALEKRPEDRHPSAAAFAEELDLWLAGGRPTGPLGALARAVRWTREHALALCSAALVLAGIAVGGAAWWRTRPAVLELQWNPPDYLRDLVPELTVTVDAKDVGSVGPTPRSVEVEVGLRTITTSVPGWRSAPQWIRAEAGHQTVALTPGVPVDPLVEARVREAERAPPASRPRIPRNAELRPQITLLAPRGDVRLSDLAQGWVVDFEEDAEAGALELYRGNERLWRGEVAPPERGHVAQGRFPRGALVGLVPGDTLRLAWTPARGTPVQAEARVVAALEAGASQRRLDRMLDPRDELAGRLKAESLLGHGLPSAALHLALEHVRAFPGSREAWGLLQAIVARQDAGARLLDDMTYHLDMGQEMPVLPAPAAER